MSWLVIDRPSVTGSTLECELRGSPAVERFLTGESFRVTYDRSIEAVPEPILTVPVLANVCPVAWALGADVYVDRVDREFAAALTAVEDTLCGMHDFLEGSTLYARTRETPDLPRTDDRSPTDEALLFTGGVDSTCSYVRHRNAAPTLVSIRGWTITPDQSDDADWQQLRERVTAFADERDLETAFIETNALTALDHTMLLAHYKRHVDGAWYSSVGHGLGLLGLCAPMAATRGIETLHVAATHWDGIDLEWGSCPEVDESVRWTGTRCHHDGYQLTRQERLDVIADYVRTQAPDLSLQTCNIRMDGNCGDCEKCYRTAIGLRLADLKPADHGYAFDDGDYAHVRAALEGGEWELGTDEYHMWADLRERACTVEARSSREQAFFEWLTEVDLAALVDQSEPPLAGRLVRGGVRNAPTPVYKMLYPRLKRVVAGVDRLQTR